MGRAKRNPSLGRPGKRWVSPLALPILRCHFLCPEPDRRGGVYRISTGCSLHSSTLPSRPYRRRPSQCLPGARSPASTCARKPTSGCCGSVRSEEHKSELQSLMRISYAALCLDKTKQVTQHTQHTS